MCCCRYVRSTRQACYASLGCCIAGCILSNSAKQVTASATKMADGVRLPHSGQSEICHNALRCVAGPLDQLTSGCSTHSGPLVNMVATHAYHVTAPTPWTFPCDAHVVAHVQVVLPPADQWLAGTMPVGYKQPSCKGGCKSQLLSSSSAPPVLHVAGAMCM